MGQFGNKSLAPSPLLKYIRKHPFLLFGLPFVGLVVASSFALENFTRTRYDYHATKVQSMSFEEELGLKKDRKKVDLREEYFKLSNPGLAMPSDSRLDASTSASSTLYREPSASGESKRAKKKKFSMAFIPQDELENVRAPRPEGVPDWGVAGDASEDAPIKGRRKEDRWV